jgi:hypothetical protein
MIRLSKRRSSIDVKVQFLWKECEVSISHLKRLNQPQDFTKSEALQEWGKISCVQAYALLSLDDKSVAIRFDASSGGYPSSCCRHLYGILGFSNH